MNSAPATRARHLWRALCATALLPLFTAGCWHGPTARSNSAVVTFRVADETFRALLVGDEHIEAARAAQAGGSARIPNGRIVRGTGVNPGWSWHLEDVEFVEVSIELCDGREGHTLRHVVDGFPFRELGGSDSPAQIGQLRFRNAHTKRTNRGVVR